MNTYDLSGEYGIGYTTKGEPFYFDLEDYEKIKDYCWHVGTKGSIVTNYYKNNNRRTLLMHRYIMNVNNPDIQVDHIYHKRFDNRKSQLRIVTNSQNQMNTIVRKDNKSNVKGVIWHKIIKKWFVYINVDKKRINLGYFSNFNQAVNARKKAEKKYFGGYNYEI